MLATAPAGASAQSDDAELRFTPRLVHYSLRCHTEQQCRFECFQGGESVVSRIGIGRRDAVRLAANVGIGETIAPLWIEIRPHESGDVQTVLLDRHTVCDFQSMTIEPFEAR